MKEHNKHYYEKDRNLPVERKIKFFKLSEFDSPDMKGSGENMDLNFVRKLDEARELAKIPFKINSGFRTPEYNIALKKRGYHVASNSAHMNGLAADISTPDSKTRFLVLESLIRVGFNRIGIGKTFIHADTSGTKSQEVLWHYY
jgi:zinc D-Ala-D-Ala carboxypeptidase